MSLTPETINLSNCIPGSERMPPLAAEALDEAQQVAAQALINGPRKGIFGPFIPLLRSPGLMNHLQKVGEYLRFHSSLDSRTKEFVMLIVSRQWTQQFEWCMHYPLALQAGVPKDVLDALAAGRRPAGMHEDEALAYDLCDELIRTHGLSDATYRLAVSRFGEAGVIDLVGLIGYFSSISMIMNVARTPPMADTTSTPLVPFPG